jgi:hypothetical protein
MCFSIHGKSGMPSILCLAKQLPLGKYYHTSLLKAIPGHFLSHSWYMTNFEQWLLKMLCHMKLCNIRHAPLIAKGTAY